jgi:hypothetical protein
MRLARKRLLWAKARHFDPIRQPWLLPFSAVAAAGGKDAHLPCKCSGGIPRDFDGAKSRPPVCGRESPLAVPAFVGSEPAIPISEKFKA